MATVVFNPRFEVFASSVGDNGRTRPVCNRVCGTSACRNARLKGKCPAHTGTENLATCETYRYLHNGVVCNADFNGGDMVEVATF